MPSSSASTHESVPGTSIPEITTPCMSHGSTEAEYASTPTTSRCVKNIRASFESFLKDNPKSRQRLLILKRKYGIAERQKITYVAAAKLVGVLSHYPTKEKLVTASVYLAAITGLKPTDFFKPKSHKSFLAKCTENTRSKLASAEKRWTWTPHEDRKNKGKGSDASTQPDSVTTTLDSSAAKASEVLPEDYSFVACC